MAYRFRVIETHTVRADQHPPPTQSEDSPDIFPFSVLDEMSIAYATIPGIFTFDYEMDPSGLMQSLAKALNSYPHLSGRVVDWPPASAASTSAGASAASSAVAAHSALLSHKPKHGFTLNNAGVAFTVAELEGASINEFTYERLDALARPLEFAKFLAPPIKNMKEQTAYIQYTRLADGSGSLLTYAVLHCLQDGQPYFEFFSHWSSIHKAMHKARETGFPLDVGALATKPLAFDRSLIHVVPPSSSSSTSTQRPLSDVSPSGGSRLLGLWGYAKLAYGIFTNLAPTVVPLRITAKEIEHLKGHCAASLAPGGFATTNDIAMAVFWRVILLLRGQSERAPSRLVYFVNIRRKKPSLPANFATSAIVLNSTTLPTGDVLHLPLHELVARIHADSQAFRGDAIDAELDWHQRQFATMGRGSSLFVNINIATDVIFSSWNSFGVFDADFHEGRYPRFFTPFPAFISVGGTLIPAPRALPDGGIVFFYYPTKRHFATILTQEWQDGFAKLKTGAV